MYLLKVKFFFMDLEDIDNSIKNGLIFR